MFSHTIFSSMIGNIDNEIALIKSEILIVLKTVHLPRGITDVHIIDCLSLLKDIFIFCL